MQAAGFVVSDAVAGLWRVVRSRHGFATFVDRAAPQLLRWETGHGWTIYDWGSVAEKESSLAEVLEAMLQVPDHWRAFAARYLEAFDEVAGRSPGTSRHRSRSMGRDREDRARALAQWHTLLLDRLSGSEDEDLLDRLVVHRALVGPESTFLQAQLARRRGDDEAARKLVHDSLVGLPGHPGLPRPRTSHRYAPAPTRAAGPSGTSLTGDGARDGSRSAPPWAWPCDPVPSADVRKVLVELESHAGRGWISSASSAAPHAAAARTPSTVKVGY
jgi:hypothetical protein